MEKSGLSLDDVKKKRHMENDEVVYVNTEKEDEGLTSSERLKIISNRKRWKLAHGFKLKKRNKRLEKKGVFEA